MTSLYRTHGKLSMLFSLMEKIKKWANLPTLCQIEERSMKCLRSADNTTNNNSYDPHIYHTTDDEF